MSCVRSASRQGERGFTLVELLVVIAIIAILAALLLPALARAKQRGQRATCLSDLSEIVLSFSMYVDDAGDRFPDRRDLKGSLPGGYHPWTTWPPSDPRGGWAAVLLAPYGASPVIWSCPAAVAKPVGNLIQTLQATSMDTNGPMCRYWMWRFDRTNDLADTTMLEDFWTKTEQQAISDLQSANDATVGPINGPSDVELAVDPYFPSTVPTVPAGTSGFTIHPGGRCRGFLDGHVQYIKDSRTPF